MAALVLGVAALAAGCAPPEYSRRGTTGGAARGGSGGTSASGGARAVASGGMPGSGGGAVATGGSDTSPAEATGGAPGAGGTTTGGASGAGADDGNAGGSAGGSTGAAGAATGGAGTGGSGTGGANLGGAGAGGRGTGGANTGGAATGGAATGGAPVDPARYGFENDTQAWTSSPGSAAFTKIASDSSRSYAGRASLAATINATAAANYELLVKTEPPIPPGTTVTARVYVPAGAAIDWLQIYVQEGAPGHVWTGFGRGSAPGSWATISVTAPASGAPIATIGIQTPVTRAWSGTIYVDSVTW